MAAPLRAGIYVRVSTINKGQDIDLQLVDLRKEAARRGWDAREFVDEGVSGAKASRPGLDALMAEVRARRLDVVAVWRFDRFARSLSHLVAALQEFTAAGVEFVSMREGVDTTTSTGRLMFGIIASMAQFERELLMERIAAGVENARRKGVKFGRKPKDVPVEAALALLDEGRGFKETARLVRVNHATLRRRLVELGVWPRPVQNSPAEEAPLGGS